MKEEKKSSAKERILEILCRTVTNAHSDSLLNDHRKEVIEEYDKNIIKKLQTMWKGSGKYETKYVKELLQSLI